jgi:hypothetical protein
MDLKIHVPDVLPEKPVDGYQLSWLQLSERRGYPVIWYVTKTYHVNSSPEKARTQVLENEGDLEGIWITHPVVDTWLLCRETVWPPKRREPLRCEGTSSGWKHGGLRHPPILNEPARPMLTIWTDPVALCEHVLAVVTKKAKKAASLARTAKRMEKAAAILLKKSAAENDCQECPKTGICQECLNDYGGQ